jgi:hypothetical protein
MLKHGEFNNSTAALISRRDLCNMLKKHLINKDDMVSLLGLQIEKIDKINRLF